MRRKMNIDKVDHDILYHLQENADITNKQLSKLVRLTEAPLLRRVKDLKKRGYIKGIYAQLNPILLGRQKGYAIDFMLGQLVDKDEALLCIEHHPYTYQLQRFTAYHNSTIMFRALITVRHDEELEQYMKVLRDNRMMLLNVLEWRFQSHYSVGHKNRDNTRGELSKHCW